MNTTSNWHETADELGVSWTWLRDNLQKLPHHRYGRSITFEADDIQAIRDMHRHVLAPMRASAAVQEPAPPWMATVHLGRARRPKAG